MSLRTTVLAPLVGLCLGSILLALVNARIPSAPAPVPFWTPRPMPTETGTATPGWWDGLPTGTPALPPLPGVPTVTLGQPGQSGGSGPVAFQVESCPGPEARIADITASGVWWLVEGTASVRPFWYWKIELSPNGNDWTLLYRSETPVTHGRLMEFNTTTVPPGTYRLKLTVVKRDGNYPKPCVVRIVTG